MKPALLSYTLLSLLSSFSHAARIYYTDQPNGATGHIIGVNLDGTSPSVVASHAGADLRGIAWHPASGRIFFLDNAAATKRIRSVFPNGSGQLDVTTVNASLLGSDLEIHQGDGHIYWTESNSGTTGNGFVRRANLDGTGAITVVTTGPGTAVSPYFLFVDENAGYLYWGVQEGPSSNSPTNFARATFAGVIDGSFFITSPTRTRDIVVDPRTSIAYWNDRQSGAILRRSVNGGSNQSILSGLNAPHGLVADLEARKLYLADTGQRGGGPSWPNSSSRRVARCNFDGTEFEQLTAGSSTSEPWDITIDLSSPTYADWKPRFFSTTTPLAQPLDDADGDGGENVLEYGLGSHPRRTDSVAGPVAEGSGVRYQRRRGTNLAFRVEASTDLATWRYNGDGSGFVWTVESSVTTTGDFDSVLVVPGPALTGAQKVLFRVVVTSP